MHLINFVFLDSLFLGKKKIYIFFLYRYKNIPKPVSLPPSNDKPPSVPDTQMAQLCFLL